MMMMDLNLPWTKKIEKQKDRIYFTSKNSELDELQTQLESFKIPKQIEAMKEIIAGMTIGKDVSPLFPYVVNCMRTKDLELKKLIYLYIINFAKIKPNESILAVNSFLIDASDDSNPIIQALAIRTMGCIRVDEIVSYLCDTLKNGLKSNDSYVNGHNLHGYGNIGVTAAQTLFMKEVNVAKFNMYEHIADLFASEFCLMIY